MNSNATIVSLIVRPNTLFDPPFPMPFSGDANVGPTISCDLIKFKQKLIRESHDVALMLYILMTNEVVEMLNFDRKR